MYLSLGSNVRNRKENLRNALVALASEPGIALRAVSRAYETAPVGDADQPEFINLTAEIETELAPLELLNAVKALEVRLGRIASRRWGPRLIDIDIILFADQQCAAPELTIPHPEFRKRAFVLAPLCEIAPDAVDPATGKTIRLLAADAEGAVRSIGYITP